MFTIDPISPLPALIALLFALVTTWLLVNKFGAPSVQGRFASIDGLRGYLAFFVFLHHSCIWYFYLRTDKWDVPPSYLYTHFGQTSVVLFFMITGFLFFSKLLEGRTKPIDWEKLFISRFLRLTPLYLFAISVLFVIVAHLSGWKLNESIQSLTMEVTNWVFFTIYKSPDINGVKNTWLILAGAMWTLPYEWFFYISLPIIALFIKVRPSLIYLAGSLACIFIMLFLWQPGKLQLLPFLGGIISALIVRNDLFKAFAIRKEASFITTACICLVVVLFPSAYGTLPIMLLSIAFALIAGGNSVFGLLLSPVSRAFGEMTYSMYLLHGIVLYSTFNFLLDSTIAKTLTPATHWILVIGVTPVLVLSSFITFRLIERPALQFTNTLVSYFRKS